jgi:hypothetical protein
MGTRKQNKNYQISAGKRTNHPEKSREESRLLRSLKAFWFSP